MLPGNHGSSAGHDQDLRRPRQEVHGRRQEAGAPLTYRHLRVDCGKVFKVVYSCSNRIHCDSEPWVKILGSWGRGRS